MWLNELTVCGPRREIRRSGFTLIEVLVSLLVLATGLIVMANFQGRVTTSSIDAKARSEAMQLAQQRMEWLRARDLLTVDDGLVRDIPGKVASYDLSWILEDDPNAPLMRAATVRVDWTSSRDEPQWVELVSYVAANAYAGSLNPGSGVQFAGGSVPGPGGGARIKRYDPNDLPGGRVHEFGNIDKLEPNELGNIEFINTDTGEAIEILTPHRAAFVAGTVYVRTDQNVGRVSNDLTEDVFVRATPISLCGYDEAASGNGFEYYPYRCYLAASDPTDTDRETFGWYGNIGILHPAATNQDGVCVGSLTPATALPASVRQYRGYETRDAVCEEGEENCGMAVDGDGKPLLFPVGIGGEVGEGIRQIEDHNFLVARLGNNPTAADCAQNMAGAPPADSPPFNDNPPEFFCFSENPELCPDREFGVSGPEGCAAIGAVCDADGEHYNGMVYAGATVGLYYFTSREDELPQTWGDSAATCASKDANKGWFLGGVREVQDLLHLNYEAFRDPPDAVLSEPNTWSLPLAPGRYWTRDPQNASRGYFVDIVGGSSGRIAKTTEYVSRCLFTVAR
jgi:prepilin-type N-terminal cleavage/methylation domain-containing protein